jgi:phosphoribosylamine---glycine ligase
LNALFFTKKQKKTMNILVLGSGGREHTFAWKLAQSPLCEQLYIAPGNAGTRQFGANVMLDVLDFEGIKQFMLRYDVTMLIVGPEEPLVRGIYDFFANDAACANIVVIGPSQQGAMLEGSKAFAKKWMRDLNIPTAAYREFSVTNLAEGIDYLATHTLPIVLKADGLAAGKGVVILSDRAAAQQELRDMLGGKFGAASERVVVEEFLTGIEFSVFALTDGNSYQLLPIAKDYKRIGEGDTGLNTGGMGAVSPPPFVDDVLLQKVITRIVEPTIKGLQDQKIAYKGVVFIGLISVNGEPFVIEYNCRMGDPETEVVLPRLQNDLVELFAHVGAGTLAQTAVRIDPRAAAAVMLVAGGYPETYRKGDIMTGWQEVQNSLLFHAGTADADAQIVTNGGRILAITSYGNDFKEAVANSLRNAEKIQYTGKYFRRDIGFDL